jgi:hypothetical protein
LLRACACVTRRWGSGWRSAAAAKGGGGSKLIIIQSFSILLIFSLKRMECSLSYTLLPFVRIFHPRYFIGELIQPHRVGARGAGSCTNTGNAIRCRVASGDGGTCSNKEKEKESSFWWRWRRRWRRRQICRIRQGCRSLRIYTHHFKSVILL